MHWLNLVGLVLNTIAAALMFYFPPAVQRYTAEGEAALTFKQRMTKVGPQLLIAGFACQLIAAI
jgi:hypothetical protein